MMPYIKMLGETVLESIVIFLIFKGLDWVFQITTPFSFLLIVSFVILIWNIGETYILERKKNNG